MFKNKLLTIILSGFLAACITPYEPPASGPLATLTFEKHPQQKTAGHIYSEAKDCIGRRVPLRTYDEANKTIVISANAAVSIAINYGIFPRDKYDFWGPPHCMPTGTFYPESGKAYIARALIDNENRICTLQISRIEGSQETSVPFESKVPKIGDYEGGSWCIN